MLVEKGLKSMINGNVYNMCYKSINQCAAKL